MATIILYKPYSTLETINKQIITVYIQYRTIYARASLSTLLRASAKSGPDIVSMAIDPCACNGVFVENDNFGFFERRGPLKTGLVLVSNSYLRSQSSCLH